MTLPNTLRSLQFCLKTLNLAGCDQFIWVDSVYMVVSIYSGDKGLDILGLYFFPQNVIPNEYRSKRWKYFKAYIRREHRIKSCGIHLIYAQAQNNHKKISRNRDNPAKDESQSHHKRSRHHVFWFPTLSLRVCLLSFSFVLFFPFNVFTFIYS